VLTEFDDVSVSICDPWQDRLEDTKSKWNIPADRCFTSLEKLIDKINPDGFYVLIPQYTLRGREESPYLEVVKSILSTSKPIFVEKPLAMNFKEAKELAEVAAKAGVITNQVGYQRRFHPLLREGLKRVYDRGSMLNCSFCFFKGEGPYKQENPIPIPPYSFLTVDFIHCLDLMRWVPKAEIVDFSSSINRVGNEPEISGFYAMGKFDNGCTSFFASNMRVGTRALDFQLHGVGISVYITMDPQGSHPSAMKATIFSDGDFKNFEIIYDYQSAGIDHESAYVGFWQEDRHFVDCVQQGIGTECDFFDAAKSCELADRVLKTSV
jgi:predicted dehydrogenase